MRVNLKLWQKGIIIIALPLICELLFVSILSALLHGVEIEARNTERSRNIVLEAEQMERMFFQAGAYLASYQTSKNPLFVLQYHQQRQRIAVQLEVLDRLCRDNAKQRIELKEINGHIDKGLGILDDYREKIERDDVAATPFNDQVKLTAVSLGAALAKIISNEKEAELHRPRDERHLRQLVEQCLVAGISLNIIIAIAISVYFSRSIARRLLLLGTNSERLAQQQILLPKMNGSDEIAQLDAVFHQMAETLVEATRKERAVVDNAVDVICTIDPQGRFAACNPAGEKIWGYASDELRTRELDTIVNSGSRDETKENFSRARKDKMTCVFENEIVTKSGALVDMCWSVFWSDSEELSFCVAHDISERKRAEQLRKEVLDMVTHDLRTPLASMELSIDMLQQGVRGTLTDAAQDELAKIKRSSSRLINLVNDLLDMEKLKEGKLRLSRKEVNLQLVVESAFEVIASAANQRKIRLSEKDTDVDIFVDGVRISQVLINLISNAIKFAPENSEVRVESEVVDIENEVIVRVVDNGPGMSSEESARLFQRFSQLDAHLQQGSGMGLAICKALIELHGGTIGVDSTKGKGSVFWFRVPIADRHSVSGNEANI